MQRVFLETVGNYRRGDCPERPAWWWEQYKKQSLPLLQVIEAGLKSLNRPPRRAG